jgi:hypothetical protein
MLKTSAIMAFFIILSFSSNATTWGVAAQLKTRGA